VKKDLGTFYVSIVYLQMTYKKVPKSSKIYSCETCDYHTSRLSQYDRHVLTAKHQILTNVDANVYNKVPKSSAAFICECGNKYKHRQSLYTHKKKCTYIAEEEPIQNTFVQEKEPSDKQLMMTIIKQNGELAKQNGELVKTIQEMAPNMGDVNNSHNTNTNCNNTVNIQMFLDNKCKDAISIQDFINSIELNTADLLAINKDGYVDSVSNVLIKALNKLDITNRPLHCTDLKRDVVYIKDIDSWNKTKSTDNLMDKAVEKIENKHYMLINEYLRENPQSIEPDTPEEKFYSKTCKNILGNNDDHDKLNKKIYKNVLPKVKLNKENIT